MMPEEPTQKTQPADRKPPKKMPRPIDIPIPSKAQIERDFTKIVTAKHDDEDDQE